MSVSTYERRLNGKRVVCLGGTSGIGYAVAARAVNEGASVVVVSSRQEKVDLAISRLHHDVEGYAVDLTNEVSRSVSVWQMITSIVWAAATEKSGSPCPQA